MRHAHVTDAVGHTPLVRLRIPDAPDVEVYAKLELQNLYGMKDRVARNVIREARRVGMLTDGAPIVESSSGTMALGVALVGRALGHPVHIVTDPRIDPVTLAKLRALGCDVHVVGAMTSHGWQSARLERLEELLAGLPGAFWPQQYANPDNPGAYREVAAEILADLADRDGPAVDVLVGSVGSGGSLCGSARALRAHLPALRTVGVDCVGSALFGQPDWPQRRQSGLGNSLNPKNLDRRLIDEVHWLNDHEAFAATRALVAEQQIFGGNTSGSVYRVLTDVARRLSPGARVVGIMPDRGDRYGETVYSDEYWSDSRLDQLPVATEPTVVTYGTAVRTWSRADLPRSDETTHLLFVESNTTGTGMLALHRARSLGLAPVLLSDAPDRYAGLTDTGAEVLQVDTNSLAALRAAVIERFRRDELAGVTSTSDFYIPTVAKLAAWLGLPGNSPEAVATCRDKARLRDALAAAGVSQPRYVVVGEGDDPRKAVAAIGLPCVVKPADDSGSNAVRWCVREDEVLAQVARIRAVTLNVRGMPAARHVLVEEYVEGPEYSVEMFGADVIGVTAKQVGPLPHFVESGHMFPATIGADEAAALVDAARRALVATGMSLGATHIELKSGPSGPSIIEINPRLAGGMIPELIRLATGSDVLTDQIRAAVGQPVTPPAPATRHAGIRFLTAREPGRLTAVRGASEAGTVGGVVAVSVTAAPGSSVRPAESAYDRLGYVIAAAGTPGAVTIALDTAAAHMHPEIESAT